MKERKYQRIIKGQRSLTFEEFLYYYYQYNIENIKTGITLEESLEESMLFQKFVNDMNIKEKTHHSFLAYCMNLGRLLKKEEDPNYSIYIQQLLKKCQDSYKQLLIEANQYKEEIKVIQDQIKKIDKQRKSYAKVTSQLHADLQKLRSSKKMTESLQALNEVSIIQNKQILSTINVDLQQLSLDRRNLQYKLETVRYAKARNQEQCSIVKKNLTAFESRQYALTHTDLIKNIINNMIPLEIDDIDRNMIFSGLAILVKDGHGNILPYANPYCLEQVEWYYHNMLGEDIRDVLWEEEPKEKVLKRKGNKHDKY